MPAPDRQLSAPSGRASYVCTCVPESGDGGVERTLVNIDRGLSSLGLRVDFVCGNTRAPYLDQRPAEVRRSESSSRSADGIIAVSEGVAAYLRTLDLPTIVGNDC